ncbi:MAG: hypothetical protein NVV59_13180 [Chitinophagaceae bacterium]|nr:hypothetical protein [Chitinophagaceae bacterium]
MSHSNRRKFIQQLTTGLAGAALVPGIAKADQRILLKRENWDPATRYDLNNHIQIALIGAGGMGFSDANSAIRVPGVKLVAACDLYDGRLAEAKNVMATIFLQPGITEKF